jgi:hypothetical protein
MTGTRTWQGAATALFALFTLLWWWILIASGLVGVLALAGVLNVSVHTGTQLRTELCPRPPRTDGGAGRLRARLWRGQVMSLDQ